MGGDPQLDHCSTEAMSTGSRPENMGFMGVCSISKLLGLPMALPDVESGGVAGKCEQSPYSLSSTIMAGLWCAGRGELVGVMADGPLLRSVGGCGEHDDEPGRANMAVEAKGRMAGYMVACCWPWASCLKKKTGAC